MVDRVDMIAGSEKGRCGAQVTVGHKTVLDRHLNKLHNNNSQVSNHQKLIAITFVNFVSLDTNADEIQLTKNDLLFLFSYLDTRCR